MEKRQLRLRLYDYSEGCARDEHGGMWGLVYDGQQGEFYWYAEGSDRAPLPDTPMHVEFVNFTTLDILRSMGGAQ